MKGLRNFLNKNKYLVVGILVIVAVVFVVGSRQRAKILANSTETRLENPKRETKAYVDTFYFNQLSEKEKAAYEVMVARLEQYEGGVIEFKEPLNGKEYVRVTNAIEYGEGNYSYGIFEIPMSEKNVSVTYDGTMISDVKTDIIAKCILFLSCANGIQDNGEIDQFGRVTNLEEIGKLLATNDASKLEQLQKEQEEVEKKVDQLVDSIPADYGVKDTTDFLLQWLEDNITYATDMEKQLSKVKNMGELLAVFPYASRSSMLKGEAITSGYAKLFSHLCNKAGIPSYIALGTLNRNEDPYEICAVKFGEEWIFVDAAGAYSSYIGDVRYLSEEEINIHMTMSPFFQYTQE